MAFSFDDQKEYAEQTFKRVNYAGKKMGRKDFDHCTFTGCTFTETVFESCSFRDCSFTDCDLRLAKVQGCRFSNTHFEKSKVTGINWTTTNWHRNGLFIPVHFAECDISFSAFVGLDLKKIQIIRCIAKDADFAEADLTQADCTETNFAQSRFLHTNLTEADFSSATGYGIAPSKNTLKKTKFSLPEALSLLDDLDIII